MTIYIYKARNSIGNLTESTIEANSPKEVAKTLVSRDMTPISIEEYRVKVDLIEQFNQWQDLNSLKLDDLILFSRQMYSLTKAGVPIIRAIHSLIESTRNKALVSALADIAVSLESGLSVGHAMEQHPKIFSSLFLSIVKVGESTGALDQGFLQISQYLEREKETQSRIKLALQYPSMVIFAISIAMIIVNIYVIPAFKGAFDKVGAELPWQTILLINVSDFTVEFWPYIAGALVIFFYALIKYFQTPEGHMIKDKLILKIPAVGSIIHRASMERFSRSFAMILSAGVPLIQGISIVSDAIGNVYISSKLEQMRIGIEKGDSISRMAMSVGLFTPLVIQMIMVGEETGNISEMLLEAADFYETEIDAELKNLASVIEPFLLVVVGIMVLVLALGIFLPMWNLSSAMH
ncbi:MAG: type II secretion system F family protein [Methylococcales bacterium]|nr:type II secretion system F family protein [Methylococcales bacterium]